jgi:hypothetical protein
MAFLHTSCSSRTLPVLVDPTAHALSSLAVIEGQQHELSNTLHIAVEPATRTGPVGQLQALPVILSLNDRVNHYCRA